MFWAETVYTALYMLNRYPTRAVMNRTPIKAWWGQKPSTKDLRIFSYIHYTHIPNKKRNKLGDKIEQGIFLDYNIELNGYRVFKLRTKKLVISLDMEFDENAKWNSDEEKVKRRMITLHGP